jgi:hypothetical protein
MEEAAIFRVLMTSEIYPAYVLSHAGRKWSVKTYSIVRLGARVPRAVAGYADFKNHNRL